MLELVITVGMFLPFTSLAISLQTLLRLYDHHPIAESWRDQTKLMPKCEVGLIPQYLHELWSETSWLRATH
jgi:hypothetical protein